MTKQKGESFFGLNKRVFYESTAKYQAKMCQMQNN